MLAERADSLIGSMLGKNYRVVERIGEGGMAAVYLVEHQTLLKRFAAKVLSVELASSLEARARFTQEAHAASQLDHENIVTINDFGVTGDHRPFFVMELLRGKTLDQRLAEGPMTIEEVVAVAVPVARALAHAHAEAIVHRDVKPENIFLVQRSQGRWGVKVVDFGIAKTPVNPKLTRMGETLGSPLFMAPEMIRGDDDVDQRADVYSFGVLLYLMLCGRLPFVDDNLLKVMHMHLSSPPPPPRAVNPGLSVELAEIVDRALAKHPDDRYPSMEALLVDLEAALPMGSDRMLIEAQSGASLNETPFAGALAMSRTGQRPVALPQSQRTSAVLPAAPQRSRVPLVIALAAVAVAVVGAAGWYQLGVRSATTAARGEAAVALASRPAQTDTHAGAAGHARNAAGASDSTAGHVRNAADTVDTTAAHGENAAGAIDPTAARGENAAGAIDPTAGQVETAAGMTDSAAGPAESAAGAIDNAADHAAAAASATDVAAAKSVAAASESPSTDTASASRAVPSTAHTVPAPVRVATVAQLRPARPAPGRATPSKKVAPPRPALRRGQKSSAAAASPAGQVTTPDETATPPTGESSATAQDAAPGSAAPVATTDGARAGAETAAPSAPAAPPAATPSPGLPAAPPPGAPIAGAPAPAPTPPSAAKPAAAAPSAPRTLDAVPEIASFEIQGSLPSSVARRSVERALPGLRACYSTAARASKTAPAIDLPLGLEIDENGIATHVTLGDVRFGAFSRCAAGVASQIHAPQAPDVGTARVTTVIKFRPL